MKVKLKENLSLIVDEQLKLDYDNARLNLNSNKIYVVLEVSYISYRIINERGSPTLFDIIFFDIIDDTIEMNWLFSIDEYSKNNPNMAPALGLSPKEFQGYFYEDFFDGKRESIEIFLAYTKKHNLTVVANLAYAPHFRKAYYQDLLAKIDAREAEE